MAPYDTCACTQVHSENVSLPFLHGKLQYTAIYMYKHIYYSALLCSMHVAAFKLPTDIYIHVRVHTCSFTRTLTLT